MDFERTRGKNATSRCNNVGTYGSPLYCDCGCQTPIAEDTFDLTGLSAKRINGFQSYTALIRDGEIVGSVDFARDYVSLDGNEYLGVKPNSTLASVFDLPIKGDEDEKALTSGSTLEETAAESRMVEKLNIAEMDKRNRHHYGWCTKCHTYCYGDCEP